jgi:threonine dehydrogenase-like Zn-dependent dehydrogenase
VDDVHRPAAAVRRVYRRQQAAADRDLFTHRWQLDQVAEAYRQFDDQNAGKGAFLFDELG